jgi:hypothetical protein
MRLKKSNAGVRACALLAFVVLSVMALTAVPALALNPERAYEMVSPVYKGGYGVNGVQALIVAQDGERVAFASPGAFAGTPAGATLAIGYLARRGPAGWFTTSVVPPAELMPSLLDYDFSPSLELILKRGTPGPNAEDAAQIGRQEGRTEYLTHQTDLPDASENWLLAGPKLEQPTVAFETRPENTEADSSFCHIFFNTQVPAIAEAEGLGQEVYELNRGCAGEPVSLSLLAKNARGKPVGGGCNNYNAVIGDNNFPPAQMRTFNAIADGGKVVFFSACPGSEDHYQLFVRLGATRTLEISKALSEPNECAEGVSCARAAQRAHSDFVGASEDGSRVFFTTAAPLTSGDVDHSSDLYMAAVVCRGGGTACQPAEREVGSLVQVSHDPGGGEAGVQGVIKVAPDGSRVYFVARGELLTAAERQAREAEGLAVPSSGADNLYVYDVNGDGGLGSVAFVGDLCSAPELSGLVADIHCPSNIEGQGDTALWEGTHIEAQTGGPDGRFLLFTSYGQLTGDDVNAARDVYRYDAVTGSLDRVSTGEDGYDADGNEGNAGAEIATGEEAGHVWENYELGDRAISEDGSRVVFETSRPLSSAASNGLNDVYEWHEAPGGGGSVSLLSSGSATESVLANNVAMSASGRDIFFLTSQGLVAQDTDGLGDIYDARLGGGFPSSPTPRQPCSGDACQGPLTSATALLVPGSVTQAPGENLSAPTVTNTKSKVKAKAKTTECKRHMVRRHDRCGMETKAKRAHNERRAR